MSKTETVRRLVVMFLGFFCISMGVALLTKSDTGTSAISVIPYTVSLLLPQLSYGTYVGLFNALLVVLQIVLLRRDCVFSDGIRLMQRCCRHRWFSCAFFRSSAAFCRFPPHFSRASLNSCTRGSR